MDTDGWSSRATLAVLIGLGHVVVGLAALAFAGVMVHAGTRPLAGLGGVAVLPGVLLGLAALAFIRTAVRALRQDGKRSPSAESRKLAVVEAVAGVLLAAGAARAVQGYGAFEPWESPLLLPSAFLLVLGFAGLAMEISARRPDPSRPTDPGPTARTAGR